MKQNLIDSVKSGVYFSSAILISFGSAIVALRLIEKFVPEMLVAVMKNVPANVKISADAFWITALILVVWAMDLFVRPMVKNMMQLFYDIGKKKEVTDDGHSKANVEEC